LVLDNSAAEAMFQSARGYGAPMTTGILRFQIPNGFLESEDVIELKRGSIIGAYYYAQLLFRGLETRARWID
jgi:hypothetical protein